MPLNVNLQNMTKMHGDKAVEVMREIADLAGHGEIGNGAGQIPADYAGGLGILGALREDNTAISEKAKARIAELAGVDRKKDVDSHQGVGLPRNADKPAADDKK